MPGPAMELSWPPSSLLLDLPLCLVSGLVPGWFGGPWLHPLAQLGLPQRWLHDRAGKAVLRQAGWQVTFTHGLVLSIRGHGGGGRPWWCLLLVFCCK